MAKSHFVSVCSHTDGPTHFGSPLGVKNSCRTLQTTSPNPRFEHCATGASASPPLCFIYSRASLSLELDKCKLDPLTLPQNRNPQGHKCKAIQEVAPEPEEAEDNGEVDQDAEESQVEEPAEDWGLPGEEYCGSDTDVDPPTPVSPSAHTLISEEDEGDSARQALPGPESAHSESQSVDVVGMVKPADDFGPWETVVKLDGDRLSARQRKKIKHSLTLKVFTRGSLGWRVPNNMNMENFEHENRNCAAQFRRDFKF